MSRRLGCVGLRAAAIFVAALLTACSGEPPTPSPLEAPETSSAAVTPTSTPSPSAAPEAWEVRSVDGADAFARHWFDVFNQTKVTGETDSLRSVSARACYTCNAFITVTRGVYKAGGVVRSRGWDVRQIAVTGRPPRAEVVLRVFQPPETFDYPGSQQDVTTKAQQVTYGAVVEWRQGRWLMVRLDNEVTG